MGYQAGNACYPTGAAANTATASGQVGTVKETGAGLVVVNVTSVDDTTITYTFTPVAGGTTTTATMAVTPTVCGMLEASDGIELGWMVGGVWIAVSAVLFIARALRGDESVKGAEGYGHA